MNLGNGWTTEKLRDEILEHIWIDETGDMGGVHCMHCLGYEQGEIDRAINTVFDAALRRAKAEGIRMVETYARACVHERAVQLDGFTGSSGMAGVIRGKQSEADRIVDWAYARAAQIEEGEDLK